ncbi:hypothetical protein [Methylohalobius crimeensis]|uniref:hypothetical protein n=1 Tax=Methylohalobius crimeensis TaxID=244365 RepID=UPI0003B45276|nr:hypothetical protein [Methylohalobius crimeensis]
MTPENFAVIIENLILFGLLLWLIYGPWQNTVTDITRQKLFEIRDEIFDMAAKHDGISFDDPAYQEIRDFLHSMIRHAHLLTWPRFLLLALMNRNEASGINDLLADIKSEDARNAIREKMRLAIENVIGAMVLRSPILLTIGMLATPIILAIRLIDRTNLDRWYGRIEKPIAREISHTVSLPA